MSFVIQFQNTITANSKKNLTDFETLFTEIPAPRSYQMSIKQHSQERGISSSASRRREDPKITPFEDISNSTNEITNFEEMYLNEKKINRELKKKIKRLEATVLKVQQEKVELKKELEQMKYNPNDQNEGYSESAFESAENEVYHDNNGKKYYTKPKSKTKSNRTETRGSPNSSLPVCLQKQGRLTSKKKINYEKPQNEGSEYHISVAASIKSIKEFKQLLPNSMKVIDLDSNEQPHCQSLTDEQKKQLNDCSIDYSPKKGNTLSPPACLQKNFGSKLKVMHAESLNASQASRASSVGTINITHGTHSINDLALVDCLAMYELRPKQEESYENDQNILDNLDSNEAAFQNYKSPSYSEQSYPSSNTYPEQPSNGGSRNLDFEKSNSLFQGEMTFCSKKGHQIVNHSARLIYPESQYTAKDFKIYEGEEALQKALSIFNKNMKKAQKDESSSESFEKSVFSLIFEPDSTFQPNAEVDNVLNEFDIQGASQQEQQRRMGSLNMDKFDLRKKPPIDFVNKQRRFYAFCLPYDDFDIYDESQDFPDFNGVLIKNKSDISCEKSFEEKKTQPCQQQVDVKALKKRSVEQDKPGCQTNQETFLKRHKSEEERKRIGGLKISHSRKVFVVFSKYPFLTFFQKMLANFLKESLWNRQSAMDQDILSVEAYSHCTTIKFIRTLYQKVQKAYKLNKPFQGMVNESYEIKYPLEPLDLNNQSALHRFEDTSDWKTLASVNLSWELLEVYHACEWAYPLLSLFSLDTFLDVFTLVMLEEKIIFVCENERILTGMIFLFTKIFTRPFSYPYPVVSIIPNEFDYFNAPFPIVYGCMINKFRLLKDKVTKAYKNTYVFVEPTGIEVHSYTNLSKVLTRKSPKLRDKLLPLFLKIAKNASVYKEKKAKASSSSKITTLMNIGSFLGFGNRAAGEADEKKPQFLFDQNDEKISLEIIQTVHRFLKTEVFDKMLTKREVNEIKSQIEKEFKNKKKVSFKFIEDEGSGERSGSKGKSTSNNIDIDKELYSCVKDQMVSRTRDPFVEKFFASQIVNMAVLG